MEYPDRKSPRLRTYDYASDGAYFITLCTHDRRPFLSEIISGTEMKRAENRLTSIGSVVEEELLKLQQYSRGVSVEKYVIMPNHIHFILYLQHSEKGVSELIGSFKSITTNRCLKQWNIYPVFQKSFYDHVIRGSEDYERIWNYIDTNPDKWEKDRFFI